MSLGFTFSLKSCRNLELDCQETLLNILSNSVWDSLRLPLYWDILQPTPDSLHLDEIKWILDQASIRNISILPIIGYRNAVWPEIHRPNWLEVKNMRLFEEQYYRYIDACLSLLKTYQAHLRAVQVENEPFEIEFGIPEIDMRNRYPRAIDYIRSKLNLPILISYGYKPWRKTFQNLELPEDIIGLDFYSHLGLKVHNIPIWLNMFKVPGYKLRFKADISYANKRQKPIWITELQAEPWDTTWNTARIKDMSWSQSLYTNSPALLKKRLDLMQEMNLKSIYLWGIEWWYTLPVQYQEDFYAVIQDYASQS